MASTGEKPAVMHRQRAFVIVWIWALLFGLVSYSFDLECLVERQSCAQGTVHLGPTSDCAQPGLVPSPLAVAVLPPSLDFKLPPALVATPVKLVPTAAQEPPPSMGVPVPLGLRAPPLA